MHFDDFIGREESVANTFFKRIRVNRLAEIMDVRDILGLFRRGGETDLSRRGKIFKDFAPGGVIRRAAAVAFVDDD
jgi:hypothetical protein